MTENPVEPAIPPVNPLEQQKGEVKQSSESLAKGLGGTSQEGFRKEMGLLQELIDKIRNLGKPKP